MPSFRITRPHFYFYAEGSLLLNLSNVQVIEEKVRRMKNDHPLRLYANRKYYYMFLNFVVY